MLRKIGRGLTFVLTAVAAMLSLAACGGEDASAAWEVCPFAKQMPKGVAFECDEAVYAPNDAVISAKLMNIGEQSNISCGAEIYFAKLVGRTWRIVPHKDNPAFILPIYSIGPSESHEVYARTETLVAFDAGLYRIYRNVVITDDQGNQDGQIAWAEFKVVGNAGAE